MGKKGRFSLKKKISIFCEQLSFITKLGEAAEKMYKFTISAQLRKKAKDETKFIEGYVLLSTLIIPLLIFGYSVFRESWARYFFILPALIFSIYFLYEIFIFHVYRNIALSEKGKIHIQKPGRSIGLVMTNFFQILLCLTTIKIFLEDVSLVHFINSNPCSFWDSLYFMVVTLFTLGYGEIHPDGIGAKLFVISSMLYFALFFFVIFPIMASAIKVELKD
jgi:hypothetical protein